MTDGDPHDDAVRAAAYPLPVPGPPPAGGHPTVSDPSPPETPASAPTPHRRDLPRWLGAPGRWFHGVLLLVALIACWASSVPGGIVLPFVFVVVPALIVLGGLWLARLILCLATRRRPLLPFVIAPAVVVVLVGLVWFDVPLRARFEVSRPALTAFVRDHPDDGYGSRRVGLFEIAAWESLGDGMVLTVGDGPRGLESSGLLDDNGFAYLPDGPASLSDPVGTRVVLSLGHGWYTWTQSW